MTELRFEADSDELVVRDPIERRRVALSITEEIAPKPADIAKFSFPVDTAISTHTDTISLSDGELALVRDSAGKIRAQVNYLNHEELPPGRYTIELSTPIKLYLQVESALTVSADDEQISIDFGGSTKVLIGARSHHDRPATTVTTTADPEDLMQAVSVFGSALKATSPERSYPSLRGHPPRVKLGNSLDVSGLEPPDTGVILEVPPEYQAIFVVSPLAYYLGAQVVPGDEPLLRTDHGFTYSLDGSAGFERTVERTLKQVFFLDCLTRTEGLTPVDLHERRALESDLDLDFAALYDDSLSEQLKAYLTAPFELLGPYIPKWKLTAHVEPTSTNAEMLPFVVDDLAVVRSPHAQDISVSNVKTAALDEFMHGGSTRSASTESSSESSYVQPTPSDSLERAWVGDGTPLGASKATVEAYENRLDRTPAEGDIDLTIVCNDAAMDEERGRVNELYANQLPFTVTVERDLTTAELADVLTSQAEFLHYIGHVDSEGFQCVDGKLDATTLDSVSVEAFLLNACQSYHQGMALIERGAIGGTVTISDVLNRDAVTVGRAFAGLLNCGFPLRAALKVARNETPGGGQYIVVGDGSFALTQAESGTPNLCEIEHVGESFYVEQKTYPTADRGLGSLFSSFADVVDTNYYLSSGTIQTFEMSASELERFLKLETIPLKIDGKLRWSDRFDLEEYYRSV